MKKRRIPLLFIYLSISLLHLIGIFMLSSCSDKDDPSPSPTPENITYVMKLKATENVEFKEILGEKGIKDITEKETVYFGERIQLACPNELQFNNDSLSIIKSNNTIEKYKIKWQEKELFIHNTNTDKWEYCGEKDKDGKLLFNTGFYIIKSNNSQRTLTVIGQEYDLVSYTNLISTNSSKDDLAIIWLKIRYIFV